jgi:hypothetical protein
VCYGDRSGGVRVQAGRVSGLLVGPNEKQGGEKFCLFNIRYR